MSGTKNLSLEFQRQTANRLLRLLQQSDSGALAQVAKCHPRHHGKQPDQLAELSFSLHDAQITIARQHGFSSWSAMVAYIGPDVRADADHRGLTAEQLRQFKECGYVRARDAFRPQDAGKMEHFIWNRLRKLHAIEEHDRSTWSVPGPWVGLNQFKRDAIFAPLYHGRLPAICDQLFGVENWTRPTSSGGFLVTFPESPLQDWDVPRDAWHVDAHFNQCPERLFAIRVFSFVSNVLPRSGGTLVVRGSHRLVKRFVAGKSAHQLQRPYGVLQREFQDSHPWLRRLCGRCADDLPHGSVKDRVESLMDRASRIGGVEVQVEEFSGKPGEIIIAHPWILHVAGPRAGPRPRFMITKDITPLNTA